MKNRIVILILILFCNMVAFSQDIAIKKGTISISIKNIKNNKGQIRVCLFNKKDGFPDRPEKAYKIIKKDINEKNNMIIEFNELDYQEYAVAVLHDEDANNEMKNGIFGISKEGYGVSNNIKGRHGAPEFDAAKIKLNSELILLNIEMVY